MSDDLSVWRGRVDSACVRAFGDGFRPLSASIINSYLGADPRNGHNELIDVAIGDPCFLAQVVYPFEQLGTRVHSRQLDLIRRAGLGDDDISTLDSNESRRILDLVATNESWQCWFCFWHGVSFLEGVYWECKVNHFHLL